MSSAISDHALLHPIPALLPRGPGHQFVVYGDSCSGIPGAPHERTFAAVNAALRRLTPPPEFILFLGDEVAGLTPDPNELRMQWRHWLEHEMAWLDKAATPLFHATSNHTTYDTMSEAVFRDTLPHLPRNGPPGQDACPTGCGATICCWFSSTRYGPVSAARVTSKPSGSVRY